MMSNNIAQQPLNVIYYKLKIKAGFAPSLKTQLFQIFNE